MSTPLDDDWELLLCAMPEGWQTQMRELGGFRRLRRDKISTPEPWLRLVLLHAGVGLSYQQTATRLALKEGLQLTKAAVWKRVEGAGAALAWCVEQLLGEDWAPWLWVHGPRPLAVDGSWVSTHRAQVEVRLDWALDLRTFWTRRRRRTKRLTTGSTSASWGRCRRVPGR